MWVCGFEQSKMRQSGGLPLAAGLDGGNTLITSNPSSSAKTKGNAFYITLRQQNITQAEPATD